MEDAIVLLDQLIEEHKQILQGVQTAEQAANDAAAILKLDRAKEDFVPGMFGDQKQSLQNLRDSLEAIDKGLQTHFAHEDDRLLTIFHEHGGSMLASGLRVLLLEHQELQNRITESRKETAELVAEGLSREVREGKAWGVRVYMGHTAKLIQAHAQSEEELFHKLRIELMKRKEN